MRCGYYLGPKKIVECGRALEIIFSGVITLIHVPQCHALHLYTELPGRTLTAKVVFATVENC